MKTKKIIFIAVFSIIVLVIIFIIVNLYNGNNLINLIKSTNRGTGTGNSDIISLLDKNIKIQTQEEISPSSVLEQLKSKDDIISEHKFKYFDEVNRIETYYTEKPFYEYYLFLSVKNNDINECNKITEAKKNELCKSLFLNKENKEKFMVDYKNYYGDDDNIYAENMFEIYSSISNNNCTSKDIIFYLACKKIFNKKVDVNKIFMDYSILKFSNMEIGKKYFKELSHYWGYDESFDHLVEESLYKQK